MMRVTAKEIAKRLEKIYKEEIRSYGKYEEICKGCNGWFSSAFDSPKEFQKKYLTSDFSFVNILASCLKNERRMLDFLCVCNPWALWHFDISLRESIEKLKGEGSKSSYSVPTSDVHFLKKFSLFVGRSGKK